MNPIKYWDHRQVRAYSRYGLVLTKQEIKEIAKKITNSLKVPSDDVRYIGTDQDRDFYFVSYKDRWLVTVYSPSGNRIVTFLHPNHSLPVSIRKQLMGA